jgi:hypothetical protein
MESRNLPEQLIAPLHYRHLEEDEINLIDIWITLSRYRRAFTLSFLILLFAGLAVVFGYLKDSYSLETVIQVGTMESDSGPIPIESPGALLTKIERSILPSSTETWIAQNDRAVFSTEVSNPKGTDIIVIKNNVLHDEIPLYQGFHESITKTIISQHQALLNSLTAQLRNKLQGRQIELDMLSLPVSLASIQKPKELQIQIEQSKLDKLSDDRFIGVQKAEFQNRIKLKQVSLEELKETEGLYKLQLERLSSTQKILEKNITSLAEQLKVAQEQRRQAAQNPSELKTMSILLIDNEIQQNQDRLLKYEERLFVTLENQKSELLKKADFNKNQQQATLEEIRILSKKYEQFLRSNEIDIKEQRIVLEKSKLELENAELGLKNQIALKKQKILELETLLDNFSSTRVISTATPSLKPVGLSKPMASILVILLSLFASFALVLLLLFKDKVRERKQELATTS